MATISKNPPLHASPPPVSRVGSIFDEILRLMQEERGESIAPVCKQCLDLGYVFIPNPDRTGDPGTYELCSCQRELCRCDGHPPFEYFDEEANAMRPCPVRPVRLALHKARLALRSSGIPPRFQGKFLDGIDQRVQESDNLTDAVFYSVRMIARFQSRNRRGLYLHGDTGCGKTLLSCAILNEIIRAHREPVRYAKISRDILGKLRASFNPNSEIYGEGKAIEDELARVPALVIDDFGVHRETEWVNQVLYDLIDARYENDLLTIITSNEPMDTWKGVGGGRIYSRLREMCAEEHIKSPDYRLRNRDA
ncbi:MAG: ATP-binding protein [Leptospiraceae bacterium]|nr:ATP-binding protein [Leptospiraceae bacterium]MCB1323047.1 ATP-binding protein [Leptospiraceae bacterium]